MTETQQMDDDESKAIIAGIVGSGLAILVIIGIGINIGIYLRNKQKNQQQDASSKYIYILAYITLGFFILTPISQTFMRSNFVLGPSFDPYTICFFAYFMYYFPYSMGQFTLSTLFLYRLHTTFKESQYRIRSKTNIGIAAVFGFSALLFVSILVFNKKIFINVTTPDRKNIYCANYYDDTITYVGWLGGYAIQTLYNMYVLYAFIQRLYCTRKDMLQSIEQNTDIRRFKLILKLNRIMIKMCFLVTLSILFTWVYLVVGIFSFNLSFAVSYSIILDTICMWLLFSSVSQKYWDILVNIFYFPCLCFKICPSIKEDQTDFIVMKHFKRHTDLSGIELVQSPNSCTQNNNNN